MDRKKFLRKLDNYRCEIFPTGSNVDTRDQAASVIFRTLCASAVPDVLGVGAANGNGFRKGGVASPGSARRSQKSAKSSLCLTRGKFILGWKKFCESAFRPLTHALHPTSCACAVM